MAQDSAGEAIGRKRLSQQREPAPAGLTRPAPAAPSARSLLSFAVPFPAARTATASIGKPGKSGRNLPPSPPPRPGASSGSGLGSRAQDSVQKARVGHRRRFASRRAGWTPRQSEPPPPGFHRHPVVALTVQPRRHADLDRPRSSGRQGVSSGEAPMARSWGPSPPADRFLDPPIRPAITDTADALGRKQAATASTGESHDQNGESDRPANREGGAAGPWRALKSPTGSHGHFRRRLKRSIEAPICSSTSSDAGPRSVKPKRSFQRDLGAGGDRGGHQPGRARRADVARHHQRAAMELGAGWTVT